MVLQDVGPSPLFTSVQSWLLMSLRHWDACALLKVVLLVQLKFGH